MLWRQRGYEGRRRVWEVKRMQPAMASARQRNYRRHRASLSPPSTYHSSPPSTNHHSCLPSSSSPATASRSVEQLAHNSLHLDGEEISSSGAGEAGGGSGQRPGKNLSSHGGRIASGFGYQMLRSMGWKENTGLGVSTKGIVDPILPATKPDHLGLGFNPAAAQEAAQAKIKALQKAKREERDAKLRLQEEKTRAAAEEAEAREKESRRQNSIPLDLNAITYEQLLASGAIAQASSSSDPYNYNPLPSMPVDDVNQRVPRELKSQDGGRCPHCRQQFDSKRALKLHINVRHAALVQSLKRLQRESSRQKGRRNKGPKLGKRGGSVRGLAPMSQNFSVYD